MKQTKTRFIAQAGITAAMYVVFTYISALLGISSGVIQCRLSEALCILPAFFPAAVPGLFAGCLISNLITGAVAADIIFGSAATLIGAIGTYALSKKFKNSALLLLPPIASNTVIVPIVLKYAYGVNDAVWFIVLTVFAGEVLSAGVLGTLLHTALKKHAESIFGKNNAK